MEAAVKQCRSAASYGVEFALHALDGWAVVYCVLIDWCACLFLTCRSRTHTRTSAGFQRTVVQLTTSRTVRVKLFGIGYSGEWNRSQRCKNAYDQNILNSYIFGSKKLHVGTNDTSNLLKVSGTELGIVVPNAIFIVFFFIISIAISIIMFS